MNERRAWNRLATQYTRGVKRALASVKHPRKAEVLADLQTHLEDRYNRLLPEERSFAGMCAVIAEMGPPEEYAQLLGDGPAGAVAAEGAPTPQGRAKRKRGCGCLVALALLGFVALSSLAVFLYSVSPTCQAFAREIVGANFTGAPFFSERQFGRVQPGMSAEDVRNRIGFPLRRTVLTGQEKGVEWSYTVAAFAGAPFYTGYSVVFDRDSGQVIRTTRARASAPVGGSDEAAIQQVRDMRRFVTPFWFGVGGTRPDIVVGRQSDPRLEVYLQVRDPENLEESLKRTEAEAAAMCDPLDPKRVHFVYLVDSPLLSDKPVGQKAKELVAAGYDVRGNGGDYSTRRFFNRPGRAVFLSHGWLYEAPAVFVGPEDVTQLWRDDRTWLYRHLLGPAVE